MYKIRTLTKPEREKDLTQIISLVNEAFLEDAFFKKPEKQQRLKTSKDDPKGVDSIEDVLTNSEFIVCEDAKEILGCIRVEVISASVASFGMVSVPSRNQRKGIGRMLVKAAESWATEHGSHRIEISVVNIRTPVIQFYEHLGYVAFGYPVDFDEMLGGEFLSDEYKGTVKFIWMAKDI